jgi:hypothetical protein
LCRCLPTLYLEHSMYRRTSDDIGAFWDTPRVEWGEYPTGINISPPANPSLLKLKFERKTHTYPGFPMETATQPFPPSLRKGREKCNSPTSIYSPRNGKAAKRPGMYHDKPGIDSIGTFYDQKTLTERSRLMTPSPHLHRNTRISVCSRTVMDHMGKFK